MYLRTQATHPLVRWSLAVLTFLALIAPGCLEARPAADAAGTVRNVADSAWSELALPFGDGHDHFQIAHHANLTTPNFEILGHEPLLSPSAGRTIGGHHCGDAQPTPGGKRLAAVEMRNVGGFALADITDPLSPKWLGEFVMRSSRVYDLAVVPDGRHVLLVTTEQIPGTPSPPFADLGGDGLYWRPACNPSHAIRVASEMAEDSVPRPSSFLLVSIEDPAEPRIIDQRPIPRAGHSVFSTIIDGRTWILVSVYGFVGGYYQIYELTSTPAGARLNLLSTYMMRSAPNGVPAIINVHDGWIHKHPVTGRVVAYVAGGADFEILDLSNPRDPRVIGRWTDVRSGAEAYSGTLHSVFSLDVLWEERHYTLLGPEFNVRPGPQPSGTIWVLDTTDPIRPVEVAAWTLPHQVEWNGTYMFSNHYFSVVNRTAFVSMYHGGAWALDLTVVRPDAFTLLPSIGVFMPDRVSPKPPTQISRWTPTLQEVLPMPDGTLVTFDGSSGLYTFRFDASRPMPSPEPWPIEPVTPRK